MKVISLHDSRAARRRRERNRETHGAVGMVMHAMHAVKRDGTVGPIKQVAFMEDDSEPVQRAAVRELLEWAYNYSGSEQSRETGIARVLSPEATVIYRQIRESEQLGDWTRLFSQLAKDKVTFHMERRGVDE